MAETASTITAKFNSILLGPAGLESAAARVAQRLGEPPDAIASAQIAARNVTAEISERTLIVKYPSVHIYCERVVNSLREKFRVFSGKAHMVAEVRVSQDRLEALERQLQIQVDVITEVLDSHRGDWENGMFYTGGYDVLFGPVRHGGKNFLQLAKVTFEVELSK